MWEWLRQFFSSDGFMPHVHCYLQEPGLTWTHVISDALIGLAYVAISLTLVGLVRRGRADIPFHSMFLAFGLFIIACGGTHFMEIWTTWTPTYWVSAAVKAVTAVASVITAIALPPMVPVALGMIRAAKVSEERRVELEQAHAELEQVYGRLKEYDELKTRFFTNISHELRTPLTLILGPAEKLLRERGETAGPELEIIRANAQTLLKHVNDLLDVARLEGGEVRPEYAGVNLTRRVRRIAAQFDALAAERSIDYRVEVAEAVQAQVDPAQVQQMLVNLLANAFKFTPAGGTIRCSAYAEGERVVLEVGDSGPGIPEELRQRVFERFHQASSGDTRRFGGTGLGLAIVQEFAELHGGAVEAGEAPEGGALLRVSLPLRAPDGAPVRRDDEPESAEEISRLALADLRGSVSTPAPVAPEAPGQSPGPTVLVVEDNAEMRRFVAESLPGYRVLQAANGELGLQMLREHRPDVVLTDLMMPQMSGEELIRAARQDRELDGIPIIVLTARPDEDLRAGLLGQGAQDYLLKPFSLDELRARVENLVQIKRTRELLELEVESRVSDLEGLASELKQRRRDLQDTVESLRAALEQAERASRVKTNFLGLISHELRTPVTTLQLQLQVLERDRDATLTPRQKETVRRMEQATQRLADLIDSLLEHTRLGSGLQMRSEPVELQELAGATVEELRPHADLRQLELRYTPSPQAPPPLRTDGRLVRLILVNLVMNAVKFTSQGEVEVSTGSVDGWQYLQVRDTGPGIPEELQDLIFEPFEQLEPMANKHHPGIGLGLSLVKEMTTALGGRLELQSRVGEGSTFRVLLPEN